MRRYTLWITSIALAAATLFALRAPAVAPPANLEHALTSQRALAAERPGDAEVLNDLGNLLVLAEETEAAEEAYRQALEIAPDMVSAHYNLALLLGQEERHRGALRQFERVIDLEPGHAWAHYQVGAIHDARGADRRAIRHYALAFRLDPQLAFSEVNPHVLDNEHVTEAMLHAYRDPVIATHAPKTYEQPTRIVDLLIPSPPAAPPVDAMAREEAPGTAPRSQATFAPGAAEAESPSGAPGAEGERVLRERDLERGGTVNQIVVPGSPQPRGGTRVPPVRTYTPPGRVPADGRAPDATPGQPAGRQRFVPGVPSTGRLDIELFPQQDDRQTLAAGG